MLVSNWQLNQDPGIGNQEPGIGNQKPGIGNQEPAVGNQEPGIGNQKPGNGNQEPDIVNKEPGMVGWTSITSAIIRYLSSSLDNLHIQNIKEEKAFEYCFNNGKGRRSITKDAMACCEIDSWISSYSFNAIVVSRVKNKIK